MSFLPESILVLGSGGLLGRHVVSEYAKFDRPIFALTHNELDVTDEKALVAIFEKIKPQVIINCAALCNFQRCEDFPELSAEVNQDAPIQMARLAAQRGIKLVHFSTDYIFDGKLQTPYSEVDMPHPLSVYGTHKAAVEAAFQSFPEHLLLRVAWLFGTGGKTFLSLLPDLLMQRETVEVASGKRGSCLHAGYAGHLIRQLIDRGASGLYNLVHSGETSWEGFARECLRLLMDRGYQPLCRNLIEVPLDKMTVLSGSRPIYSVLDVSRLSQKMDDPLLDWQAGLSEFLDGVYPVQRVVLA